MNKRPHKGLPHEEHADESWLIPYADLLTLLMALFIVLFGISNIDAKKYEAIRQYFAQEFGTESYVNSIEDIPPDYVLPNSSKNPPTATSPGASSSDSLGGSGGTGTGTGGGYGKGIDALLNAVQDYVHANSLENVVSVAPAGENVLITMKNDICFESGQKYVTAQMRDKISVLATILKSSQDQNDPFKIIVTGYTDNIPMTNTSYTNWDLSVDRALECLRILISDSDLDPIYFSVRGYGELYPIASNDTPEGRQKNRRVEVLVSPFADNIIPLPE